VKSRLNPFLEQISTEDRVSWSGKLLEHFDGVDLMADQLQVRHATHMLRPQHNYYVFT